MTPERIRVAQLPGTSPRQALVWVGHPDTIIVRDPSHPPEQLIRYLHAPACRPADAPLRLSGPWLGIIDANGRTEIDMVPPYTIDLFVNHSAKARYARAFLTVRVPRSLGRPLSRGDIRRSLWKGGSITVTVTCSGGRYVAAAVAAAPPAIQPM